MDCCRFTEGDLVDWLDTNRAVQDRFWHGKISLDRGISNLHQLKEVHTLLVEWTDGSSWQKFTNLLNNKIVHPKKPHQQVQLCSELRICNGDSELHPPSLK